MRRREFITLLVGATGAWPLGALAQQIPRRAAIGFLLAGSRSSHGPWAAALVQRLGELGWADERNVVIEHRWAEGHTENHAGILEEFLRLKVDIIIASGTAAAVSAKQATSTVPIVFPLAGDPIENGLVTSLARPGSNATGLSLQQADTAAKRLELLREVVPDMRHLAILANVGYPAAVLEMREVQTAANKLGLGMSLLAIRRAEDIEPAFEAHQDKADALFVCADGLVNIHRRRINELALRSRLPTMHDNREYVDAGGLMSYGPNIQNMFRRAADFVDKILRGAKPNDIPVEQPTKFDLVINMVTAKGLGLTMPRMLLGRADEVIE